MNVLASECSSGCESGWTIYLDQSFSSLDAYSHSHRVDGKFANDKCKGNKYEDYENEDLSMVSDASSGPPHFHQEEVNYTNINGGLLSPSATLSKSNGNKMKKNKGFRHLVDQQQLAYLDDTASSPAFNYSSQNNYNFTSRRSSIESVLDFSQDVPTSFERGSGSAFQGHYGYMQSSHSETNLRITND